MRSEGTDPRFFISSPCTALDSKGGDFQLFTGLPILFVRQLARFLQGRILKLYAEKNNIFFDKPIDNLPCLWYTLSTVREER